MILIRFQWLIVTLPAAQTPTRPDSSTVKFPEAGAFNNTELIYKITDAPNHALCYDVYANGKLSIHQTSISAMPVMKALKQNQMRKKLQSLQEYELKQPDN